MTKAGTNNRRILKNNRNRVFVTFLAGMCCLFVHFLSFSSFRTNLHDNAICLRERKAFVNEYKKFETASKKRVFLFGHRKQVAFVATNVLVSKINTEHGTIEDVFLLGYRERTRSPQIVPHLRSSLLSECKFHHGFIQLNTDNVKKPRCIRHSILQHFRSFSRRKNRISVSFVYDSNGVQHTKTFIFRKEDFTITIRNRIINKGKNTARIQWFSRLKTSQDNRKQRMRRILFFRAISTRYAYSVSNARCKIIDLHRANVKNVSFFVNVRWMAVLKKYFIVGLIPKSHTRRFFDIKNSTHGIVFQCKSRVFSLSTQHERTESIDLWLGPRVLRKTQFILPHIDHAVDGSFLRLFSRRLSDILLFVNQYTNNFGFSIVLLVVLFRTLMHPISKAQFVSSVRLKRMQSKIRATSDYAFRTANRRKIIELCRKERINPFVGCILYGVQIPFFVSFCSVLSSSIDLHGARFVWWIHDLSHRDPYGILPLLMGLTTIVLQRDSCDSTNTEANTSKASTNCIAALTVVFFLGLPSGVVLYNAVNNLVTIVQRRVFFPKYGVECIRTEP